MTDPFSGATIVPQRTVAVFGRTLQSLARVRSDIAWHLRGDRRVKVVYGLSRGSQYVAGARAWARRNKVTFSSTKAIMRMSPALVISASPDTELFDLGCPVLTLPHGAGHNKLKPELTGPAGIAEEEHRGPGGRTTDCIVLPGAAAEEHLQRFFPDGAANAIVAGDVCWERMRRSAALKSEYRDHYGIRPEQRLIVVSTTHGENSLARRYPDFLESLLDELPETYRLAIVGHPNIEFDNGIPLTDQLIRQQGNGLILTDVDEWRDVMIAADLVITDHGSTGFYAAALEIPVAMVPGLGHDRMLADSPLLEFEKSVPEFTPDGDREQQLLDIFARFEDGPLDFDFERVLGGRELKPTRAIVRKVYEMIGLEPVRDASVQLIEPSKLSKENRPVSSRIVFGSLDRHPDHWKSYPATSGWKPGDGVRVVDVSCRDADQVATADVVRAHDRVRTLPAAVALISSRKDDETLAKVWSVRVGEGEAYIELACGRRLVVRCEQRWLDLIPSALLLVLKKLAAKALSFDIAKAVKYIEGCFKVPLTIVPA